MNFKVVGAGGIGTCLLPTLCRFLQYSSGLDKISVTIIDGDKYTRDNQTRQAFKRFSNKADSQFTELSELFKDIQFYKQPFYVNESNIKFYINEDDVILLCVDNNNTRYLVSKFCEELENISVISGGNDFTDGSVQVFLRRNGVNKTLPLTNDFHKDLKYPTDYHPSDKNGCLEMSPAAPQLLISNFGVAALMLFAVYKLISCGADAFDYDDVYFDIMTANSLSYNRRTKINDF